MSDIQVKYLELFISESREHLDSLDAGLIELEKDITNQDLLKELMRHSHTLKGIAASVGYGEISNLAHSFEGMLENIKNGLSKGGTDLLFGAVDELRRMVDSAEKTGPTQSANPLVDQVGELEQADKAKDTQTISNPSTFRQIDEVRVRTTKLDALMDLVAEIMVNKLKLDDIFKHIQNLDNSIFKEYSRLVADLQYQVLQMRLTPIAQVFNRFPRMVRDQAKAQGKQVNFSVEGAEIEVDRSILDQLGEPLVHLLRNAVDHGIEQTGDILVSAKKVKDQVVVTVADTGRGVDWSAVEAKQKAAGDSGPREEFLFSGISTAEEVTETSGRGVGLSVVRNKIESLGGNIIVASEMGKGTSFIIHLPVSLAIVKALIVRAGSQKFAITLSSVERLVDKDEFEVKSQADQVMIVYHQDEVPIFVLGQLLHLLQNQDQTQLATTAKMHVTQFDPIQSSGSIVLTRYKAGLVGLQIDEVLAQQDIIVKPIHKSLRDQIPFSAVTLLGDGKPVPILDFRLSVNKHVVDYSIKLMA